MNGKRRRIFYLSLILVFFAAGPIIIFRGLGYNFRLNERKIVGTGLFYVASEPNNADIYLNGQLTKKRTPARIASLKQGEYLLTLKKTGFKSWQKKLNIYAHYTTFADQVMLFKNNPTANLVLEKNILFARPSPASSRIAVLWQKDGLKSLQIINPSDRTAETLEDNLEENVSDLYWDDEKYIVVKIGNQEKNDWRLFNLINGANTKVSSFTIQTFDKLIVSHSSIYGMAGDIIYQIDPDNKKIQALNQKPAKDFQVKNNNLYYLTVNAGITELIKNDLSRQEESPLDSFPGANHSFMPLAAENLIIAKDRQSFCFYEASQAYKKTCLNHPVNQALLSPNQKKLLYYNGNEIFSYELAKNEENLITRQGQKISQVLWYQSGEYIIYNTAQSVRAIEGDLRGTINNNLLYEGQAEILNLPSAKEIVLLIKNDRDKSDGLYNLIIQ